MPADDDFTRHRDPRAQRTARVVGLAVAVTLVALGVAVWLTRAPTPPAAVGLATPSRSLAAEPSSPLPTPVPSSPLLGPGFSVTDDGVAGGLVTFGGTDSFDATWIRRGDRWSLARPSESPPGRFEAAMAYDPVTGVVMLQGGRLATGDLTSDTWAWDGSTWRELDRGVGGPPGAEASVMAWDKPRGVMVLVTGRGPSSTDTWTWNGSRWVRSVRGGLPSGTLLVGLALDPVTQTLLGAGCCSVSQGATSTWSWDGSAWSPRAGTDVPTFTVALATDPATGHVLLFGDPSLASGREMWSWSGRDWMLLAGARLPAFPSGAVTDSTAGHLVVVGSVAEPVLGHPQPLRIWSLSGSTWRQLG